MTFSGAGASNPNQVMPPSSTTQSAKRTSVKRTSVKRTSRLPSQPSSTDRPRLLALHGAKSNNHVTRMQLDNLRITETADITYLHGPIEVEEGDPDLIEFVHGPFYSWLDAESGDDEVNAQLVAAVQHVLKAVEAHGERAILPRPRPRLAAPTGPAAAPRASLCPAQNFI